MVINLATEMKWTNSLKDTNNQITLKKQLTLINLMHFKDIEFPVKNHPTKKVSSPDGFIGEFYETFKEENTNNSV